MRNNVEWNDSGTIPHKRMRPNEACPRVVILYLTSHTHKKKMNSYSIVRKDTTIILNGYIKVGTLIHNSILILQPHM
jgi:hypothetical protein